MQIKPQNIFLFFASIYTPLFLFSFFEYFFLTGTLRIENEKFIKLEIPQKFKALNDGYKPLIYPKRINRDMKNNEIIAIGGMPSQLTYLNDQGYGLIKYKSDRFGLRNYDKKWLNVKNKDNIFLIGDSFVNGYAVPKEATLNQLIQKKTNLNTLSLGMASNSPYEYIAVLRSIIKPLTSKSKNKNRVILFFYYNDNISSNIQKDKLIDSISSVLDESFTNDVVPTKKYTKTITNFIKNNYPNSPRENKFILIKEAVKASTFYRLITLKPIRDKVTELKNILKTNESIRIKKQTYYQNTPSKKAIKTLSHVCKKICEAAVVIIPNSNYWRPDPEYYLYKKELKVTSELFGIRFIDGEEVIDKNNLKDYAPKGAHLSINGYEKLSNLIIKKIK